MEMRYQLRHSPVELAGFEPATLCLQSRCATSCAIAPCEKKSGSRAAEFSDVGPGGLEPPTSSLSGMRSNHLSYGPNLLRLEHNELK